MSKKIGRNADLFFQFMKFCAVGFFGAMLNYSIFFVAYSWISFHYSLASASGFLFSVAFSFYLNKKYTFKGSNRSKNIVAKYFFVNIFSLSLGLLFLTLFVEILSINVYIGNILVIGIQTTSNFTGSKLFVFKNDKDGKSHIKKDSQNNSFTEI